MHSSSYCFGWWISIDKHFKPLRWQSYLRFSLSLACLHPSHVRHSWRRGGRGSGTDEGWRLVGCIGWAECNGATTSSWSGSYSFGVRRTGAIVTDIRMEALVVGGVLDRLNTAVWQQNVVFPSGHAVRIAVLRMAEVVSGVEVTYPISKCVARCVLMLLAGENQSYYEYVFFCYTQYW